MLNEANRVWYLQMYTTFALFITIRISCVIKQIHFWEWDYFTVRFFLHFYKFSGYKIIYIQKYNYFQLLLFISEICLHNSRLIFKFYAKPFKRDARGLLNNHNSWIIYFTLFNDGKSAIKWGTYYCWKLDSLTFENHYFRKYSQLTTEFLELC